MNPITKDPASSNNRIRSRKRKKKKEKKAQEKECGSFLFPFENQMGKGENSLGLVNFC